MVKEGWKYERTDGRKEREGRKEDILKEGKKGCEGRDMKEGM
jgi:hypothetical protein